MDKQLWDIYSIGNFEGFLNSNLQLLTDHATLAKYCLFLLLKQKMKIVKKNKVKLNFRWIY